MEEAVRRREEGTKEFMLGNYLAAVDLYASAAQLVVCTTNRELSDVEAELYVKCWGNAALCLVKEKSWNDVILCCDKIFDRYPNELRTNIKVVYRRGLANMHLDKYEDAKADLGAALAIDGTNRDVRAAIRELKARVARSNSNEKTRFGGIFGRISMYDDKSFNLTLVPTANGDELIGFPDTVLASVAQFLTKTERALVAVAMTASSKSWRESKWRKLPSEASRVMIAARPMNEVKFNYRLEQSYERATLDFMDVDKALRNKLSDEDIGGILVCTDAVNTIKVLKLKGCIGILGHGLEPLRGSRVLEQLDLSPVVGNGKEDHFSPPAILLPLLKEAVIIPILDSIIDDERSALRHVTFPKKWRIVQSPLLTQFLVRYNRYLNRCELVCSSCTNPPCALSLRGTSWIPTSSRDEGCYGIQRSSCYACKGQYCEEHSDENTPYVCESCELTFCMDCNPTSTCDMCYKTACERCIDTSMCGECGRDLCEDCCPVFWCDSCDDNVCEECSPSIHCDYRGCYLINCSNCSAMDHLGFAVKSCCTCGSSFCGEHLILEMYLGGRNSSCGDCITRASLALKLNNQRILQSLHEIEASRGYQERFEIDLESSNVAKLFVEQERMKQRWDQICSKDERKDIYCMFTVGKSSHI
jgi:hypothetical protein